ncbi:acyl-CoA thioesterase domain-containing protein [Amycolatopsis jejuensis]|uniref:acyl-CoA thioesterase domain-containing protein n=1 Tax=Amycolatopsis jejuensis TaxID=330084 RepID=UPI0007C585B9|nr:acyl-CoA thioesterase domain-containing protein [Amycolatopsis jejuensis]
MTRSFFEAERHPGGEILHPLPNARSRWGGQLRGMATSGILARAAERAAPAELRPVRWTVDLLRPARSRPCVTTTEVIRRGRRLCVAEARLWQDDVLVSKATGLFLAPGGTVTGKTWQPDTTPEPPPPDLHPGTAEPRLYYSDDKGWTNTPAPHQNASRKMLWTYPQELVLGERPTPFQHAATVADLVNVVANWGDAGLEFINADLTLALARTPADDLGLGLATVQRVEDGGLAVATAAVFDRQGPLGTVTGAALAAPAPVDPRTPIGAS